MSLAVTLSVRILGSSRIPLGLSRVVTLSVRILGSSRIPLGLNCVLMKPLGRYFISSLFLRALLAGGNFVPVPFLFFCEKGDLIFSF